MIHWIRGEEGALGSYSRSILPHTPLVGGWADVFLPRMGASSSSHTQYTAEGGGRPDRPYGRIGHSRKTRDAGRPGTASGLARCPPQSGRLVANCEEAGRLSADTWPAVSPIGPRNLHHTISSLPVTHQRVSLASSTSAQRVQRIQRPQRLQRSLHASRAPVRPLARLGLSSKINHRYAAPPGLLIGGLSRCSHPRPPPPGLD